MLVYQRVRIEYGETQNQPNWSLKVIQIIQLGPARLLAQTW